MAIEQIPDRAARPSRTTSSTVADIDASHYGETLKAALRLVLEGLPYREAAREVGLASHQDLYRAAKRLGLLGTHSERLVSGFRRLVELGNAELERRMVDAPEEIPTKDLAVVTGIAADKLARWEGWGREAEAHPFAATSQILEQLFSQAKVSVTVEPAEPAIDVTPLPERAPRG